MKPSRTLILIRHAHREKHWGQDADNGLSEKGQAQAERFREFVRKRFRDAPLLVASSPKRRCVETVLAIVDEDEKRVEKLASLDEGDPLGPKIKRFLKWWERNGSRVTIACSHGDWLPECLGRLTGMSIDLRKGAWAELSTDSAGVRLVNVFED